MNWSDEEVCLKRLKTYAASLFFNNWQRLGKKPCKQVACYSSNQDSDTANMQIRTLTRGLGMYSVKRPLMNTQD